MLCEESINVSSKEIFVYILPLDCRKAIKKFSMIITRYFNIQNWKGYFGKLVMNPSLRYLVNLKLHYISVTPKMVKKVITNINSSKVFGPDCISVLVLQNCELDLLYISADLNICLKESFPDSWKVTAVVHVIKYVGKRSVARAFHPSISLICTVSKMFKMLASNRLIEHLEKRGLQLQNSTATFNCKIQLQNLW